MTKERIGIIDLGSNSSRLVIYELHDNGAYHPAFKLKRNIRLATHLDAQNRIKEEGLAKAISCMKLFLRTGKMYGVSQWIAVATAAVRQSTNQTQFLQALKTATGISFRVLSGEEEGRYGYLGVINTLDISDALLFDIGGASTELMHVQNRRLQNVASLPYGSVNLTKQFKDVQSDCQGEEIYRFMKNEFMRIPWLSSLHNLTIVGLGGAARALAKFDRSKKDQLSQRIHGYEISRSCLTGLFHEVNKSSLKDRKKVKGISNQRADILVAGFAAAEALADQINTPNILISRSGLREGLAFDYLFQDKPDAFVDSVLEHSIVNFQRIFNVNTVMANMLTQTALYLFDSLQSIHGLTQQDRKILMVTTQIESCGCYINTEKWSTHSAYLVLSSHLHGLMQPEYQQVADLLCGKKNETTKKLSLLIRLAKLTTLEIGIPVEDLICIVKNGLVSIGKAPDLREAVSISADGNLNEEFQKAFNCTLEYLEQ